MESSAPHPSEWQPSASGAHCRLYNTVATPTLGRGRCADARGGRRVVGRIFPAAHPSSRVLGASAGFEKVAVGLGLRGGGERGRSMSLRGCR